MPLLAQIFITAEITEDDVKTLGIHIAEEGCVLIATEAKRLNLPAIHIRGIYGGMSGVTCDEEKCCVTDMTSFAEVLRKITGDQ